MKGFESQAVETSLGIETRLSHKPTPSEGVGKASPAARGRWSQEGASRGFLGGAEQAEAEQDAGLKALSCSRHHSFKSYARHLNRLEIELIRQLNR